jgi:hypothetical protein
LPTENFQGLAEQIRPRLGAHDVVLVMTGYPALPALAPYLPPDTPMASATDMSPQHLATLTQGHPRVFLVATYSQLPSLQPIHQVLETLQQQGYRLDRRMDLGNIRLGGYALSRPR